MNESSVGLRCTTPVLVLDGVADPDGAFGLPAPAEANVVDRVSAAPATTAAVITPTLRYVLILVPPWWANPPSATHYVY
jgi:hypothetical protein